MSRRNLQGSPASRPVRRVIALVAGAVMTIGLALGPAAAENTVRIKDIADFEGIRDNLLVGYGLVVGLNGSGDTLNNSPFTQQSMIGMLQRLGVNTQAASMRTKDVAAVMVTATLPAFATEGTRIDVNVGAMGDAKSLSGGVLLVTPLLGADGEVYAVSQGNVSVAGFVAQGQATSITQGIPTSGRIPTGAIVERRVPFALANLQTLKLSLRNPDVTTAQRIAGEVAKIVGVGYVRATDPHTVEIAIPPFRRDDLMGLMTDIEQRRIIPDQTARVVIDEKSGVIVMGDNVRISTVAVAQGNLTVKITETPQVSQPNALSTGGQTVVVPRTDIQVDDQNGNRMAILQNGATLREVVDGLNALGVGPRDLISILQAIKAAGALQADIEVL